MISRLRLVAVMAILLVAGACTTTPSATAPSASNAPAAAGKYPVTIQNCGKTLTFDAAPKKVITYYQPTVELMIALGLQDRVIGRGGFHESPLLPEQVDAFNQIPVLYD